MRYSDRPRAVIRSVREGGREGREGRECGRGREGGREGERHTCALYRHVYTYLFHPHIFPLILELGPWKQEDVISHSNAGPFAPVMYIHIMYVGHVKYVYMYMYNMYVFTSVHVQATCIHTPTRIG